MYDSAPAKLAIAEPILVVNTKYIKIILVGKSRTFKKSRTLSTYLGCEKKGKQKKSK